jgi:hypothetical protein
MQSLQATRHQVLRVPSREVCVPAVYETCVCVSRGMRGDPDMHAGGYEQGTGRDGYDDPVCMGVGDRVRLIGIGMEVGKVKR